GSPAGADENDPRSGAHAPVHLLAGVVDVPLDRPEALRAGALEVDADVVVPGVEVRAVEVVADEVAGLRIHGHAEAVLAGAGRRHDVRDVRPARAPGEPGRARLYVGRRHRHRAPLALEAVERADGGVVRS